MTRVRGLSTRMLAYIGIAVVVIVALLLFVRGGSSPSAQAAKAHHQAYAHVHHAAHVKSRKRAHARARRAHVTHRARRAAARKVRHAPSRRFQTRKQVAHHPRGFARQHQYAVQILPVLDLSARTFDRAVAAANGAGDLSSLGTVCDQYNTQVAILQQQYSGVPFDGAWYTHVGTMHHWIEGVYHYMQGALQQCQTAATNGDDGAAATAKSDMADAAAQMHAKDNHVRWLTKQR